MKKFMPKGKDVLKQEAIDKYGLDPNTQGELIDKIVEDRFKDEEFKANEKNRTEKLRLERENLFKAKEYYKKNPQKPGPKKDDNPPKGDNNEDRYVTKDELKRFSHRQRFPHLSDEEYGYIEALAKTDKKSFEETLEKNPVAQAYMRTVDIDKRLAGAVKAPGTRVNPGEQKTEEEKVADELSTGLPRGFSLPKAK